MTRAAATQKAPGDVWGRAGAHSARLDRGPGPGRRHTGRPSAGFSASRAVTAPQGLRQRGGSRPVLRWDSSRKPRSLQPHWKCGSTLYSPSLGKGECPCYMSLSRLSGNWVCEGDGRAPGAPWDRGPLRRGLAAAGVSIVSDNNSGNVSLFLLQLRHTLDASEWTGHVSAGKPVISTPCLFCRNPWSFLSLILNTTKRWGSSPLRGSFSMVRPAQVCVLCVGRFPGTELVP